MINNRNGGVAGKDKWKIHTMTTDEQTNYDYKVQIESWRETTMRPAYILGLASNYLFVVSAVLLCVYFINKSYIKGLA